MEDVALVTCLELPEPDHDADLLLSALRARGLRVGLVAWDDEKIAWADYRLAVVRSTWNYYLHPARFAAWAERAARATRLYNPPRVLSWNADKAYLRELEAAGVRIAPTEFVARGETRDLGALMDERGWTRVVVKPRVSAGSFETYRYARSEVEAGTLAQHSGARDVMVQPYLESVETYGERSMVFVDGQLAHAIRKAPRFAGGSEAVVSVAFDDRECAFAERAIAVARGLLGEALLYARVDCARDASDQICVMELELCEPSLFLRESPPTLVRLVDAIEARVREAAGATN